MEIPPSLLAVAGPRDEAAVRAWWLALGEADRLGVVALWDRRREARFFEPQADESGHPDAWDDVPRVRGGRFVPHDDAWGFAEWGPDYFQHMLDHPELYPILIGVQHYPVIGCTRHPAARACCDSGAVPLDFECPVADAACPLRALRGARLSPS